MSDPRQVVRQLDIIRTLQTSRYGMTTADLAAEYGITVRTLQRDLGDLKEAGFRIQRRRRADGQTYNSLEVPADLPLTISFVEMAALLFVETLARALDGSPFRQDLHALAQRLLQVLPDEQVAFLRRTSEVYAPHMRGRKPFAPGSHQILADLNRAVLGQQVCRITYHGMRGRPTKSYELEPLRLLYYMEAGGLYLVARVPPHEDPITLAVERILELELKATRFSVPARLGETIESRLRDTFGIVSGESFEVRVRFTPAQAPYIREREWHPSQELIDEADGGVVAVFRAGSPFEIRAWVLSFGAAAEVLAPDWFREEVKTELTAAAARYGTA